VRTSAPAAGDDLDIWKDVFVHQPLPWARLLQSAVLHLTAVALIWGMSLEWLRQQKIIGPTPFDRSSVITYSPNEYLPPLDTGKAAAPQEQKGEPAFAKQPILSVPREADNRSQTIVAPSDLKLDHDVPLPNIIATGAIAPVVPLEATRSLSRNRATPDTQVVAPAPDAHFTRDANQAALRSDIVPPPPEVTHDRARGVARPETAIVEPPPEVTAAKGRAGLMNIGPSQVVAPAPQLTVAEQHTIARGRGGKGLPGSAEPVGPPPSVSASGGSGSQGRLIALGIHPVAPTGPVAVPAGSRKGTFAAGPNGKAGAAGTPDLRGSKSASNGTGGTAPGSGSKGRGNGSLPAGLHVGAGSGATGSVQRDGRSPNGTGTGDGDAREVASLSPAEVAAAKRAGQRPASKVSEDKITDLDRQVFGERHPYAMTVNMPNLNSFTGSWVLRFAEMTPDEKQGDLLTPVPMEKSDPGYPLELMKNNVHGQVTLYAVIHSDGKVGDIRVLSSPDDRLDRYAVSALARWKFVPAEKDGKAVAIEAVVVIPFKTRAAF
jgi:protein TonB